ncbi:MAG TPA: alkaline phosphatase family protein [Prosthecobacter sp.]
MKDSRLHFPWTFLACWLALPATSLLAHGPGKQNDFDGKRVLFIGIDGCRADALTEAMSRGLAPQMKALAESGVLSHKIYAGGRKDTATHQPTVSGPGWSSLLTGVWKDKHHVENNRFLGGRFQAYPHFLRRLEDVKPTAWSASFANWPEIHRFIADGSRAEGKEFLDEKFTALPDAALHGRDYPDLDIQIRDHALDSLRNRNPDVMFVYFAQVDEYGHGLIDPRANFSPDSNLYLHAIGIVDSHVGELVRAVRARPAFAEEDWLIILTTDHGGRGNSHGGDSDVERNIWLLAHGGHFEPGELQQTAFGQTKVPHFIFRHLGLPSSPDWDVAP